MDHQQFSKYKYIDDRCVFYTGRLPFIFSFLMIISHLLPPFSAREPPNFSFRVTCYPVTCNRSYFTRPLDKSQWVIKFHNQNMLKLMGKKIQFLINNFTLNFFGSF